MAHSKMISFAQPRRFLLLGGGATCAHSARIRDDMSAEVQVATRPRHATEGTKCLAFGGWLPGQGISCSIHRKLDDDFVREQAFPGTLAVSFGAAWDRNADLIQALQGRIVNFHPAPMPLYRGAGGVDVIGGSMALQASIYTKGSPAGRRIVNRSSCRAWRVCRRYCGDRSSGSCSYISTFMRECADIQSLCRRILCHYARS